jgi:hypothetical protein
VVVEVGAAHHLLLPAVVVVVDLRWGLLMLCPDRHCQQSRLVLAVRG